MEDKALLALLEEDPEEGMPLLREQYAMPLSFAVSRRLKEPSDIAECVDDALTDFYLRRERFNAEQGSLYAYLRTMKYFHGFTLREIAARLDVEYEAMKKRHQRALRRLRQLLEE